MNVDLSKLKTHRKNSTKLKYIEECLDKTTLVCSMIHTKTEPFLEFFKGDSPTGYIFIEGNELLLMEDSHTVIEGNIEQVLYLVNRYLEEMNTKYQEVLSDD